MVSLVVLPALADMLQEGRADEQKLEALNHLAEIMDTSYGEDAQALCEYLRVASTVAPIARLVAHTSPPIHRMALLLIGNMCSAEVDPEAESTKKQLREHQIFTALLPHLWSSDYMTLIYSLGAMQNLCGGDIDFVAQMQEMGCVNKLQELVRSGDDQVASFAKGCLGNMRQSILEQSVKKQIRKHTEITAVIRLQAAARRRSSRDVLGTRRRILAKELEAASLTLLEVRQEDVRRWAKSQVKLLSPPDSQQKPTPIAAWPPSTPEPPVQLAASPLLFPRSEHVSPAPSLSETPRADVPPSAESADSATAAAISDEIFSADFLSTLTKVEMSCSSTGAAASQPATEEPIAQLAAEEPPPHPPRSLVRFAALASRNLRPGKGRKPSKDPGLTASARSPAIENESSYASPSLQSEKPPLSPYQDDVEDAPSDAAVTPDRSQLQRSTPDSAPVTPISHGESYSAIKGKPSPQFLPALASSAAAATAVAALAASPAVQRRMERFFWLAAVAEDDVNSQEATKVSSEQVRKEVAQLQELNAAVKAAEAAALQADEMAECAAAKATEAERRRREEEHRAEAARARLQYVETRRAIEEEKVAQAESHRIEQEHRSKQLAIEVDQLQGLSAAAKAAKAAAAQADELAESAEAKTSNAERRRLLIEYQAEVAVVRLENLEARRAEEEEKASRAEAYRIEQERQSEQLAEEVARRRREQARETLELEAETKKARATKIEAEAADARAVTQAKLLELARDAAAQEMEAARARRAEEERGALVARARRIEAERQTAIELEAAAAAKVQAEAAADLALRNAARKSTDLRSPKQSVTMAATHEHPETRAACHKPSPLRQSASLQSEITSEPIMPAHAAPPLQPLTVSGSNSGWSPDTSERAAALSRLLVRIEMEQLRRESLDSSGPPPAAVPVAPVDQVAPAEGAAANAANIAPAVDASVASHDSAMQGRDDLDAMLPSSSDGERDAEEDEAKKRESMEAEADTMKAAHTTSLDAVVPPSTVASTHAPNRGRWSKLLWLKWGSKRSKERK